MQQGSRFVILSFPILITFLARQIGMYLGPNMWSLFLTIFLFILQLHHPVNSISQWFCLFNHHSKVQGNGLGDVCRTLQIQQNSKAVSYWDTHGIPCSHGTLGKKRVKRGKTLYWWHSQSFTHHRSIEHAHRNQRRQVLRHLFKRKRKGWVAWPSIHMRILGCSGV